MKEGIFMKGLADKLAVITGGGRGIGLAIAKVLAAHGTNVVLADINGEQAEQSAQEIAREFGVKAYSFAVDVSDVKAIESFFGRLKEQFGKIDILINNAGIQIRCPSIDFAEGDWDKLMSINLKAVFFCSQQGAKIMGEGGAIVNISSGTSTQTTPGRAPYVISKAGVNAMTAVLASEWAKLGIRVNAIAPGWIMTEMVKEGMALGVVSEKQLMAAIPFKRLADTSEIAEAVVYLASESASYITGQTLFVDGGWSALGLPQDI